MIKTREAAEELSLRAANVFQPRAPISSRELFSGRWEELKAVSDAVSQAGLHIVLFGEPGVGKSSLANVIRPVLHVLDETGPLGIQTERLVIKVNATSNDSFSKLWVRAFDNVYWEQNKPVLGFLKSSRTEKVTLRSQFGLGDSLTIDDIRETLAVLTGSVFIFDEFDRAPESVRKGFTDLIKSLSDYTIDSTVAIVGVADTLDGLVRDHASITRSIIQIQLPRMNERELRGIIEKAMESLGVQFTDDAATLIVRMSQGLPHYTHLIGLHATRRAIERHSTEIILGDVHDSFPRAVNQALQSTRDKYLKAVHSAHKDALYEKIVLACASASSTSKDALGYFHPADVVNPLSLILKRTNVTIATFQKHLYEFCLDGRGKILQRFGNPRAYKYRFQDPLLPPYVFMTASSSLDSDLLNRLTLRP